MGKEAALPVDIDIEYHLQDARMRTPRPERVVPATEPGRCGKCRVRTRQRAGRWPAGSWNLILK
ncbi:hypothetical protein NY78_1253 [Desulfovibrio sp. TomC]|nr:hypothetical protein NY78_1253 [Desulfovibrio sp. TomC]